MQFVNAMLPRNLSIFGGPEPLKISKAIDLRRQSLGFVSTRGVGQPKASTSHVLWARPQQRLEQAGFKMTWEGINQLSNCELKSETLDALWYDFDNQDAAGT